MLLKYFVVIIFLIIFALHITVLTLFFLIFYGVFQELNTAEDFISFYEEMLPLVQTLPLVLLHKESIVSKLLCRLQMKARLSLEPILRYESLFPSCYLNIFICFGLEGTVRFWVCLCNFFLYMYLFHCFFL